MSVTGGDGPEAAGGRVGLAVVVVSPAGDGAVCAQPAGVRVANQASAIRLVGAILADLHDEWQATERRYLSEHSMATLCPERDTIATAELTPGN